MSEKTAISWTDHTFNPWWGCIEVSPACDNCYARTFAKRIGLKVWGQAGETDRRFFADKYWDGPLKWNRAAEAAGERKRVFCASMADVFELNAELDVHRERLWKLIEATPWLEWLLLTKRPQNIQKMVPAHWLVTPPDNVRYGTTVEHQHYADLRVPLIIAVPAVLKPFLSMEPLLGPVDLEAWLPIHDAADGFRAAGTYRQDRQVGWVIVGGESGPHARPTHPDWFRLLRDQCYEAGVPFHLKQWGEWTATYDRDKDDPGWERCGEVAHNTPKGQWLNLAGGQGFHGDRVVRIERLGVKVTGRLLDGREWNEFPAVAAAGAAS